MWSECFDTAEWSGSAKIDSFYIAVVKENKTRFKNSYQNGAARKQL